LGFLIMPNCHFYADLNDQEALLNWLFAEKSCEVYELASSFEQPLQRFATARDVLSQFDRTYITGKKWHTVYLQLYVTGAGPKFAPTKVPLDPAHCNGAIYRYGAEGWGLVQLYLGGPSTNSLQPSHTNHNTQRRAEAWQPSIPQMGPVHAWDFKKITAFSSRLNREIRKRSVAKLGSQPVLPGASVLWHEGGALTPYTKITGPDLVESRS
jgi:hypothetical protein